MPCGTKENLKNKKSKAVLTLDFLHYNIIYQFLNSSIGLYCIMGALSGTS